MQKKITSKTSKPLQTAILWMALAVLTLFAAPQKDALALDPGCDPKYLESLQARAWLEAEREITQNQNLIFKPDSVLEYSCFDLYLNELADHAKDMFSETQRWGRIPNVETSGTGSTDDALEKLTGTALRAYIDQNFEQTGASSGPRKYDLLGGRSRTKAGRTAVDHDPKEITGETRNNYECDIMRKIWEQAKCMNFIDEEAHDAFFTFEQYRDYAEGGISSGEDKDHRFLPKECASVRRWKPEIKIATVNDADGRDDPEEGTPWHEDIVKTYYNKLEPKKCSETFPIPTGFKFYKTKTDSKDWKVCIAPGCYYNADSPGAPCSDSPPTTK